MDISSIIENAKYSLRNNDSLRSRAFLDSSGRAKTRVKVDLEVEGIEDIYDHVDKADDESDIIKSVQDIILSELKKLISLKLQVSLKLSKNSINVAVEGVRVLNMEVKVDEENKNIKNNTLVVGISVEAVIRVDSDLVGKLLIANKQNGVVSVTLDLCVVLHTKTTYDRDGSCHTGSESSKMKDSLAPELLLPIDRTSSLLENVSVEKTRNEFLWTESVSLHMDLIEAFTVTCHSRPAARSAYGATLIVAEIRHSNTHSDNIIITDVSLHPGHSRPAFSGERSRSSAQMLSSNKMKHLGGSEISSENDNRCMQGGDGVVDMTRHVRWCYAAGTALEFPLVMKPNEAFTTILQVDASDNFNQPRHFTSPIAVTANVITSDDSAKSLPLAVSSYASWTTSRIAESQADAFRVDMSLFENKFKVGEPFTLIVKVLNLSTENRKLMLLINNKIIEDDNLQASVPAVAEVGGYSFGVWGLSDTQGKDDNILAIDAARLLGDISPEQTSEADLRFVPLREGVLDIPTFKIYDMVHGRFYDCLHTLEVNAEARS